MFSMHEVLKNKLRSSSSAPFSQECTQIKMPEGLAMSDSETDHTPTSLKMKKRCDLFSRRNLYILLYTICVIGCVYQMIEVLYLYFKYETVTTLNIEKSTRVVPPSTSICFPYITLIKLPVLFTKFPKLLPVANEILNRTGEKIDFKTYRIRNFKKTKGLFDWDFGEYIETHLTLKDILSVTVTLDEMFYQCVFISPETYIPVDTNNLTVCKKVWDIDYYVKDENKCFLFSYKPVEGRNFVYNLYKLSNSYSYGSLLHQIRLDWKKGLTEKMERALVIFHPRYRLPHGRSDPVLTLRYPGKDITYTINYSKTVSQLLTAPYGSNCRNYTEIGYQSRDDCVNKCVIRKTNMEYRRVPYNMVFPKNSPLKIIGYKHLDGNDSMIVDVYSKFSECREECKKKDCYNEYYAPLLMSSEEGSKLKFLIEVPSSQDVLTELSPKLTLLEYIIYNTSVFGFWFGLCVLQLADFFEYIKKKRRDAKKLKKMLAKKKFIKRNGLK